MITSRTTKIGQLEEYKQQLQTLKIEIDTAVKGIILHFEPLDLDLEYVKNIMVERLKVNVNTIDKKMKELKRVSAEIEILERELGR